MRKFTSPLDNIHVASPCPANCDQMFGDDRKRFCGECKLNVYNLSEMTRDEAEDFVSQSEGRICVRYFRRADGTVITKNCPVGWQAVKERVSRVVTACFSLLLGLFGGLFAFGMLRSEPSHTMGTVPANTGDRHIMGDMAPMDRPTYPIQGGVTMGNVAMPARPVPKKH